jgi:hypothetical protein
MAPKNIKSVLPEKQEIILTGNKLEFTLLAFNLASCFPARTSHNGNKYILLPLFDHQRNIHLLNIGEQDLAESFIRKFNK